MFSGVRLIDERTFSVTVKAQYEPYFYELSYLSVYPYPIGVIAPGCEVRDDGERARISPISTKRQSIRSLRRSCCKARCWTQKTGICPTRI